MKFFYKWINKWENNYIEKKLKELDEHPERNKTSSGILQETLVFINDNLNMYINDHLRMYTSDYALI